MERTVHRFDVIVEAVNIHIGIHAFLIEREVSAGFPQFGAADVRSIEQIITVRRVLGAPERFDDVADERAARMPQNESGTDRFGDAEQIQFLAEFAMVALFGFFNALEILFQLLFRGESDTVNALEHRIGFLPAVIGAGNGNQFECADLRGAFHMRTAAEVNEIAAFVHGDDAVFGNIRETFQFIFLIREHFFRFVAGDFDAFKRIVRLDDFRHFFFDGGKFFDFQVFRKIEIIVEAVFRTGADIELGFRIKLFDRRRHHMRGAVADRFNWKLHSFVLSFQNNSIILLIYMLFCKVASRFEKIMVCIFNFPSFPAERSALFPG